MGAEYFSFGAGTDITELLHGLEGDLCQSPHWGYVVKGAITALYAGGAEETARGRIGGRPRTDPDKLEEARILYLNSNRTAAEVCQTVGVGRRTLFSYLAQMKSQELLVRGKRDTGCLYDPYRDCSLNSGKILELSAINPQDQEMILNILPSGM